MKHMIYTTNSVVAKALVVSNAQSKANGMKSTNIIVQNAMRKVASNAAYSGWMPECVRLYDLAVMARAKTRNAWEMSDRIVAYMEKQMRHNGDRMVRERLIKEYNMAVQLLKNIENLGRGHDRKYAYNAYNSIAMNATDPEIARLEKVSKIAYENVKNVWAFADKVSAIIDNKLRETRDQGTIDRLSYQFNYAIRPMEDVVEMSEDHYTAYIH